MTELVVKAAMVEGRRVDVRVRGGVVADVAPALRPSVDARVLHAAGAALLPGLHDHHVHLLATAAALRSVRVGPDDVTGPGEFRTTLTAAAAAAPPGEWLRGVGYHESVAGDLDRRVIDAAVADRPVRIQHRTGAMWFLNSAALAELDLIDAPEGVEEDEDGEPTGRLHRVDEWLRDRLGPRAAPDLSVVGARLARWGITGVTDATPFRSTDALDVLAAACQSGALPQRVVAMGGAELAEAAFPDRLERGPVKVVLDDVALPALDELAALLGRIHAAGRPVAVHAVSRTALVLVLAALDQAGPASGDRIEHGSVVSPELAHHMARLELTVVTQPAFVRERGDRYLADVDPQDRSDLYPCGQLLDAGVPVGGSSDMPYSQGDPWTAMRAAVERRTRAGVRLGAAEAVSPQRALELFLADLMSPGGPVRRVEPGVRADLVLVDGEPSRKVEHLSADRVAATVIAGRMWGSDAAGASSSP